MLTQNKVYRHEEHDRGMLGDARFASWDAWRKRYPGYKNGKSAAFMRSVSFERFWAPSRHRSFDTDS